MFHKHQKNYSYDTLNVDNDKEIFISYRYDIILRADNKNKKCLILKSNYDIHNIISFNNDNYQCIKDEIAILLNLGLYEIIEKYLSEQLNKKVILEVETIYDEKI